MLPKTSFAMVQTDVRCLEGRDIPIPDIDDNSAILQIEACGICGSDYEQYEGHLPVPYPAIPGHEPLGKIVAIGDNAAKKWGVDIGDRVAVETLISCHSCPTCHDGHYQRCPDIRLYSFLPTTVQPSLWGAYSQYMYIDGNSIVHKMDPTIPAEIAVMFNPLGAGFRWAVELPQTKLGDTVLIMGPGQRGLASVIAARQAGAGTIIVTGLAADEAKLDIARLYGADYTINVDEENARDRVQAITDGKGVDIVLDLTPYATQPILDSIEFAKRGGTIVLAGMKGFKEIPGLVSDQLIAKELTIKGASGVTSSGYRSAIRAIESGKIDLPAMHTHNFALEDAEKAIKTLARKIPGEESIHSCLIPEF